MTQQSAAPTTYDEPQSTDQPNQQHQEYMEGKVAPQETQPTDFKSLLSENLREDPSIQKFKDLDSMAKSYIESQKYISQSLSIPTGDASDEQINDFYQKLDTVPGVIKVPQTDDEWGKFYNELGRPQTPDEYQLNVPEGVPLDPELLHNYAETAWQAGLNHNQFNALVQTNLQKTQAEQQRIMERREQAAQALQGDWGDQLPNKIQAAKAAAEQLAGDKYRDAYEELINSDIGNNPIVAKALSMSWEVLQENSTNPNIGRSMSGGMTPEEALQRIGEIRSNPDHPYHKSEPNAVKYMEKLYKSAYQE
jgi:hypothetical protein